MARKPKDQAEAETPATESTTPVEADKAETPIDLTAFQGAVAQAIGTRDDSTGEVPEASVAPVVSAYQALEGQKAKNAAKNFLAEAMKSAMNEMDLPLARANMSLSESLTTAKAARTEKAPADPTEAFVQRSAALRLATALVEKPEGVADDAEDKINAVLAEVGPQVEAYRAWLNSDAEDKGDAPEGTSPVVVAAFKVAAGKAAGKRTTSGTAYTGERRDIGKHIAEAFEGAESGAFLTVAEIRNHKSSEYGDNPPSAGAISARLFPASGKCTVEGITPGQNDKGNKGATKA